MSQVSDWVADAEIAPPLPAVRGTSLLRRSLKLWRTRIGLVLVGFIVSIRTSQRQVQIETGT